MELREALEYLEDGHAIWKPDAAREICEAVGARYSPEALERPYTTEAHPMGVKMRPGQEGQKGVWGLTLAHYAAAQLGVVDKALSFLGKGSQAREYARVIGEALAQQKEE